MANKFNQFLDDNHFILARHTTDCDSVFSAINWIRYQLITVQQYNIKQYNNICIEHRLMVLIRIGTMFSCSKANGRHSFFIWIC